MLRERHGASHVFGIYTDGYGYARADRIDPDDETPADRYTYWIADTPEGRALMGDDATVEQVGEAVEQDARLLCQLVRGEVYGWVVRSPDGEHLESVWGYVGEDDYAWSEGVNAAVHLLSKWMQAPAALAVPVKELADQGVTVVLDGITYRVDRLDEATVDMVRVDRMPA